MGKYDGVIKTLPRQEPEAGPFQTEVDRLKADPEFAKDRGAAALAAAYRDLRALKDQHAEKEKHINIQIAAVEQLLWDAYEDAGVESVGLTGGGSVAVNPQPYAAIKDQDALSAWAEENGLGRARTVPWTTANNWAKERLLEGQPPPDGIEVKSRNQTTLRKG